MPVDCQRSTSGGKGNLGMFYERSPKICAAGLPTAQPDNRVKDSLEHYLLKDEVDALISDATIPPKKPRPLPRLRHPIPLDMRFAGPFGNVAQLMNPPNKTKFQTLVEDFKDTAYSSYWKKSLGKVQDPIPMLPEGYDTLTTFGKKTPFHGRLYDIVMPKESPFEQTPQNRRPGVQLKHKYCEPAFNPDLTYGHRTFVDKRGTYAKCCVIDDRVVLGTGGRSVNNVIQANFLKSHQPRVSTVLAPNENISNLPEGHTFGKLKPPDNLPACLSFCDLNPQRDYLRKCLSHLNSLRKCLSSRFYPTFFYNFYLNLKYFDKQKTGWLPKEVVYNFCGTKLIRFDPSLIEPLLSMWDAFDGGKIEYKTFVHMINYREPSPEIPKISDLPDKCLDFRTTYTEMVDPLQEPDTCLMAGVPSGRYFDLDYPITPERCCRADRAYLPQESDMRACLNPSVFTLLRVSHRDMYAKREPDTVKKVFEAAGEDLNDDKFILIWNAAQKYHSQGWVCFETFRKALQTYKNQKHNISKELK